MCLTPTAYLETLQSHIDANTRTQSELEESDHFEIYLNRTYKAALSWEDFLLEFTQMGT